MFIYKFCIFFIHLVIVFFSLIEKLLFINHHLILGTVISPFLLGPFLDKPEDEDEKDELSKYMAINNTNNEYFLDKTIQIDNDFNNTIPSSLMHISGQMEKSQIWKPLVALGSLILLCSIMHFISFFIKVIYCKRFKVQIYLDNYYFYSLIYLAI